MLFSNFILIVASFFYFCIGIGVLVKYKREGFYFFLALLAFAFIHIMDVNVKTTTSYHEPSAIMVKDGTLVVIDSNKHVHIINEYENGEICIEKKHDKKLISFFDKTTVSVNTHCQNIVK